MLAFVPDRYFHVLPKWHHTHNLLECPVCRQKEARCSENAVWGEHMILCFPATNALKVSFKGHHLPHPHRGKIYVDQCIVVCPHACIRARSIFSCVAKMASHTQPSWVPRLQTKRGTLFRECSVRRTHIFLGIVKESQVQNTFEGWHSKEHLPAIWAFLKPNWDLLRYFGACKVIAHSTGSICERQSQPTSQNKTKILNTCLAWLVHLHSIGTQGISRCLESFLFIPPPALPAKMIQFDLRIKGWSHQLLDTHHKKPL